MATLFQGVSAATAFSTSKFLDSSKFQLPSRRSLSERNASFLVVRSDGRVVPRSNARGRRAVQLITNAAKPDSFAASTASKPGEERQ